MWGPDKDIKKQLNLLTTYTTMKIKSNIFKKISNEMIVCINFYKLSTELQSVRNCVLSILVFKMSLNFLNYVQSELSEVNNFRIHPFQFFFYFRFYHTCMFCPFTLMFKSHLPIWFLQRHCDLSGSHPGILLPITKVSDSH